MQDRQQNSLDTSPVCMWNALLLVCSHGQYDSLSATQHYSAEQCAFISANGAGVNARLRSKQQLLHTLVERVRDQNAYTRARVLQTWMYLAEKTAIPLGHWICVTQIAVGAALGTCAAVCWVACPCFDNVDWMQSAMVLC